MIKYPCVVFNGTASTFWVVTKSKHKAYAYIHDRLVPGKWNTYPPFVAYNFETHISISEEELKTLNNNKMPPRIAMLLKL